MDWWHIFAVGGVFWWLLTAILLLGGFTLVYTRRGAYFLLSLLVYLGLIWLLGDAPILTFFQNHYASMLAVGLGYIAIAIFWFNWRWHWLTSKMRGRYDDVYSAWRQLRNLPELPPGDDQSEEALLLRAEWEDHFLQNNRDEFGVIEFRPRFRNHKNAILTWMAAWPLDAIIWVLSEVLRDFWMWLYYQFQGLLQSIMERNWRGTEGHMLSPAQRAALDEVRRQKATAPNSV